MALLRLSEGATIKIHSSSPCPTPGFNLSGLHYLAGGSSMNCDCLTFGVVRVKVSLYRLGCRDATQILGPCAGRPEDSDGFEGMDFKVQD